MMMMMMILMMILMVMKMLVDGNGDEYIGNFVDISCKVAKFESFQHSSKLSALLLAFLPKVYTFFQNVTLFSFTSTTGPVSLHFTSALGGSVTCGS